MEVLNSYMQQRKNPWATAKVAKGRYQIGGATPDLHSLSAILFFNPLKEKIACEKPLSTFAVAPDFLLHWHTRTLN